MGIIDSLPSRPLNRAEVDSFDDSEKVQGSFPVYGQEDRNIAYGLVVVANDVAHALSFTEDGEWERVEKRELQKSTVGGVHVDDMDTIQDLQSRAAKHAGAVGV